MTTTNENTESESATNESATNESATCECGTWSGEACPWAGPASDLVTVECMAAHLRGSHDVAGNRGTYPVNGAVRLRVSAECADLIIEGDGDWAEIVVGEVEEQIVEIEYTYMVDHTAERGTWTGKRSEALAAGAGQLGADLDEDPDDDGCETWTYYAAETSSRWRVSADDLAEYGAAVLSGHASEAYSLWCAGSSATEIRSRS